MNTRVTQIKLPLANAYLLQGTRAILVDSGAPGNEQQIVAALARAGVRPADLALILHTHVHVDHVGSTVALKALTNAPAAYHPADQRLMDQGHNGTLAGTTWRGALMARFFNNNAWPTFAPDLALADSQRLDDFGIAGVVRHTPGHTAGSVSVLLDDGQALIADVLMGGYLGGNVMPRRPNLHYFAESLAQVRRSLGIILAHNPHTLYVGHGGPLNADAARRRFGKDQA